ncbi:glycoside hydrolase family 31 protein [Lysobacter sp. LF1]|uniref:Glycoside hydrolase family 31 protein n=1 Tax=Lysobacter stagni TaxID=3045172 RepID=A0ABT6XL56_9GAMM|nr:glycoside hydrolase family 31 protein [Lysobacter sp. LF1]MDI9240500.1 glycoside hydrolase family 31 protein [Lysobacter sp. LF1]
MKVMGWARVVALLFAVVGPASAAGWRHLGDADRIERRPDGVIVRSGPARVQVSVHADGVFRVRLAPDGRLDGDALWAVVQGAGPSSVTIEETRDAVRVHGDRLTAVVHRSPLRVDFVDDDGRVLLADDASLPMAWLPGEHDTRVRVWKSMPTDEHYYGLGDKAGPLDRRGRAFAMWNTESYGWQGTSDPLYKSIPFFIGLRGGVAYGVFFDNTHRSSFDFGKETDATLSFGADGGALDYYFIAGPKPAQVVERYTALTGRTPLPPLWTLGFQQSRYTYNPEAKVREVAAMLRKQRIPSDAIYLDIDYQQGYAPFTIDRAQFPHFEQMIADLRAQGLRTVLITDLHIKHDPGKGYAPFDSGMAADVFIRNPDGSLYIGPVWPGDAVFPDFTLSRVRDWWGALYRDFAAMGAAGYWNDMNEPSVFNVPGNTMSLDAVHRMDDGTTRDHRAIHNVYGMLNARATYEGLLALQPSQRPFVLTRAAYAGAQRYAATWTGDNTASWHHLAQSTPNLLSLGLSGVALAGDDIGGFIGSPPPDLLTRWFQLGAFNPVFRNHAATDTRPHEAWVDGPEQEALRRAAIEQRYRLLPYLYTAAEENARTGLPIMRPVFLQYPQAQASYGNDRDFLFGADLFVAPVVDERLDAHAVTLPPGEWYAFGTSQRDVAGKEPFRFDPRPVAVPVYARAGAIVPMQPLVQHTGESPKGPLQLQVYLPSSEAKAECGGALYQDDGESFAYRDGAYLRVSYACESVGPATTIASHIEHDGFAPWWNQAQVTVFGVLRKPASVAVDGIEAKGWRYDAKAGTVVFNVADARRNWRAELRD